MKTKFTITLIICIFTFNCKNEPIPQNNLAEKKPLHKYIDKIDSLDNSQSIYIFKIDSENIITDTIGIRNLKYKGENQLVYENNIQFISNSQTINYYKENIGMVYSKGLKNDEIIFEFWTDIEDGFVKTAYHNMYWEGKVDSVFMDYHYTIDNGKKKKLIIDSNDGFSTIEIYNEFEKPSLHFSIFENDTIDLTEFIYENNELKKKIFKNFNQEQVTTYEYEKSFLLKESMSKNGKMLYQINYSKDENGNYLSLTKTFQ